MTTRKTFLAIALIALALMSGCGETPKTVVVLVDATMSIDPAEYERCRAEIERRVQRLNRGDRLVLVPISGEPEELLGHRIVHIDMPTERVPYDSNLKKTKVEAGKRIEQFLRELPEIQAKRSDIIGALRAASDAFRREGAELIVLSDMVQDNAEMRFLTMPELKQVDSAEALAQRLARRESLKNVSISVGILKSYDLERMDPERREAVQAFWRKYFLASGATSVRITVDLETLSD